MRALPTPSTNDGPGFHTNIPVNELIEHDTRAVEASIINSAPPVAKIEDGVTHKTRSTPTDPNSGIRPTEVRRPAHEGLEATSRQIEPGEKTQMSPSGLCPTRSEADRVISTFSFDPNLEPNLQNLH